MTTGKRIEQLDALRGIAAIFVVLFHYTIHKHPLDAVFKFGVTGVELFFIISGFVILMTLEKTKHWRDFVVSRFARLFPGYWTCVSLTAITVLFVRMQTDEPVADLFGTYLVNLTMAQYYFRVPDIDLAYWTMVPEMIFYVFMLGLFQLNLLRKTELVGCCVLALCMLFCYLCQGTGFTQVTKVIRWGLPIVNYFPLFVAGISFYRIKHRQNTVFNVCLLPACLLVQILLYNNAVQMHFRTAFLTMTEYTGIIMAYFIIFVLFVCNALPFITNKITVFLGSISYSLYLVHAFISMNVLIPFAKAYLTSNYLLACAFSLAGVIIIATGVTYIVEKPAMRYIRARFNKLPAADISRTPVESKKNLKPLVEKVRNF